MLAKICGLKSLEDAKQAIDNGADFLGIILVPNRARTIDINEAKRIANHLATLPQPRPQLVGVFRNQELEDIENLHTEIGLDYIQLHGDEPDLFIETLSSEKPVIRRLVPGSDNFVENMVRLSKLPNVLTLIDSENGGDGKLVNWEQLNSVHDQGGEFIIAGGLTPDNVELALQQRGCLGVDVSGGVETNGQKDYAKIASFLSKVKSS